MVDEKPTMTSPEARQALSAPMQERYKPRLPGGTRLATATATVPHAWLSIPVILGTSLSLSDEHVPVSELSPLSERCHELPGTVVYGMCTSSIDRPSLTGLTG